MKDARLVGKRVLVVEDEYLIAVEVVHTLIEAGCIVVGPFASVREALAASKIENVDLALLDVNVAGEMVFPVAYFLEEAGTPFLFATGYGQAVLPLDRPNWEACPKPFTSRELTGRLARKVKVA
jgi:DNA-binding NtrC family response regulator